MKTKKENKPTGKLTIKDIPRLSDYWTLRELCAATGLSRQAMMPHILRHRRLEGVRRVGDTEKALLLIPTESALLFVNWYKNYGRKSVQAKLEKLRKRRQKTINVDTVIS